jgi:hemerythrin
MKLPILWDDSYSVGDDCLDSQHRQILRALNDLLLVVTEGQDGSLLKPTVDRLVYAMFTHIRSEERIMRACQYPDFAQHKALHDSIWQWVQDLPERLQVSTGHESLCSCAQWWFKHLQEEDKKYTPFLLQAGSAHEVSSSAAGQ